jgi:hypothetical protein
MSREIGAGDGVELRLVGWKVKHGGLQRRRAYLSSLKSTVYCCTPVSLCATANMISSVAVLAIQVKTDTLQILVQKSRSQVRRAALTSVLILVHANSVT